METSKIISLHQLTEDGLTKRNHGKAGSQARNEWDGVGGSCHDKTGRNIFSHSQIVFKLSEAL